MDNSELQLSAEHPRQAASARVDRITAFSGPDLHDLCDATEASIQQGGGFGWLRVPPRDAMQNYWRGVLLVPERELFVARLEETICGSAQLLRPSSNNEAGAQVGQLTTFFVAPWARGHGLAVKLVEAVETRAREIGLAVMNFEVRETQTRAIEVCQQLGYRHWGTHPRFAYVEGRWLSGLYFTKDLFGEDLFNPGDGAGERQ